MGKAAIKLLARATLSQDLTGSRESASKFIQVAICWRPQFFAKRAFLEGYSGQGSPQCEC